MIWKQHRRGRLCHTSIAEALPAPIWDHLGCGGICGEGRGIAGIARNRRNRKGKSLGTITQTTRKKIRWGISEGDRDKNFMIGQGLKVRAGRWRGDGPILLYFPSQLSALPRVLDIQHSED